MHASGCPSRFLCAFLPNSRSDAGYYMPDIDGGSNTTKPAAGGTCLACPVNQYQPGTGRAGCELCAAGSSTDSTGNTECKKCGLGTYSPTPASPCLAAPKGSFVGSVGAISYTPWCAGWQRLRACGCRRRLLGAPRPGARTCLPTTALSCPPA